MANQNPAPFVYVDAATADNARRQGTEPHKLELNAKVVLSQIYASLPDLPVSAVARLSALGPGLSAVRDAEDRISALPFALLRNIVSRLPAKDAARTAVLSRRWRPVWRCSPLVFADIHILPGFRPVRGHRHVPARADTPGLVAAISRILTTHPGPFRTVHIVCGYLGGHQRQVARWVQTFADKGVQELVLVNRPFPLDVPLPAALSISARLPDSTSASGSSRIQYLLASSPILETLGILASKRGVRLRLASQHLRCVQISYCRVESIFVVDCPNLERLFLWGFINVKGSCIRFKIGHAPKLHQLGLMQPGIHMLEIGNTVISPLING
ncbi:hypothetical protein QOZ80_4AG0326100 [Eleusine coracana subsp. coracana]|nr:hypothetical protein QOZ80_4AG0326100 [Eleusine coracana subsp. coracana]